MFKNYTHISITVKPEKSSKLVYIILIFYCRDLFLVFALNVDWWIVSYNMKEKLLCHAIFQKLSVAEALESICLLERVYHLILGKYGMKL